MYRAPLMALSLVCLMSGCATTMPRSVSPIEAYCPPLPDLPAHLAAAPTDPVPLTPGYAISGPAPQPAPASPTPQRSLMRPDFWRR